MKVSIISATYNRATLLDQALQTYSKQSMRATEWEYLVCDDLSTDNTPEVLQKWKDRGLPIRVFTPEELMHPKEPGVWRDSNGLKNALSTHAFGEIILGTHPEIMIPPDALSVMYKAVKQNPNNWVTAIPYWLPDEPLPVGWKTDLSALSTMKGFYDPNWPFPPGTYHGVDYSGQHQESRMDWESEVFWAMDMWLWRWMGGFHEFTAWGSNDMDFMTRRHKLGIQTTMATSFSSPHRQQILMVYHQAHEAGAHNMEDATNALRGLVYNTPDEARKAGGIYDFFYRGHRERAIGDFLNGILPDHITRYQYAKQFVTGKNVLDIPCGTGYGSYVLFYDPTAPKTYLGVDIDEESISFAKNIYSSPGRAVNFRQGSMDSIPVEDSSYDFVISYEGMEHHQDHQKFVNEIHRVLRHGGNFIISTPHGGVWGGTQWDRYIMTPMELYALFKADHWYNLQWHYQPHYGTGEPIEIGYPGPDAQIMILRGTKL